jgi:thioredoxin reductase
MYDAVIVGGSYAGLAAAMQLGRARRSVVIVDAGQRRNRNVSRAHGVLGHDGESPAVIAAKGKAEVLAYPSVRWLDGAVTETRATAVGFAVSLESEDLRAKRMILATGVVDDIAPIPGIRERWGGTVFHCPYCDGYELDRRKLGVLAAGPFAMHYAVIVAEWGVPGETTLFLNEGTPPQATELAKLASRGIRVEPERVLEARDALAGIELLRTPASESFLFCMRGPDCSVSSITGSAPMPEPPESEPRLGVRQAETRRPIRRPAGLRRSRHPSRCRARVSLP